MVCQRNGSGNYSVVRAKRYIYIARGRRRAKGCANHGWWSELYGQPSSAGAPPAQGVQTPRGCCRNYVAQQSCAGRAKSLQVARMSSELHSPPIVRKCSSRTKSSPTTMWLSELDCKSICNVRNFIQMLMSLHPHQSGLISNCLAAQRD